MKRIFLFMFSGIFFLLAGCGAPTRLINGKEIEVLTQYEEFEMISVARATIAKNKQLTSEERRLILEKDPVLKIRYFDDRTGDASVTWDLPRRRITLLQRGTFFTPSAQWIMKVNNKHSEFSDFSRKTNSRVEKR